MFVKWLAIKNTHIHDIWKFASETLCCSCMSFSALKRTVTNLRYSQTCLIRSWRDHKKKKRIIQEFELWKLCSKYIIIKGPIKNFELYKFELDKFRCIWKYRNVPLFYVIIKWQRCVAGVSVNCDFVYPSVSYSTIPSSFFLSLSFIPPFSAPDCLAGCLPSLDRISSNTARR